MSITSQHTFASFASLPNMLKSLMNGTYTALRGVSTGVCWGHKKNQRQPESRRGLTSIGSYKTVAWMGNSKDQRVSLITGTYAGKRVEALVKFDSICGSVIFIMLLGAM